MAQNTLVPPGTVARARTLPAAAGPFRFLVLLAVPPVVPALDLEPGTVSAALSHDAGVDWPDAFGIGLARGVLAAGGVVRLSFARLSDARACERRVRRAVH